MSPGGISKKVSLAQVKGLSSNEACCQCGGGHVTATPFAYEAGCYHLHLTALSE